MIPQITIINLIFYRLINRIPMVGFFNKVKKFFSNIGQGIKKVFNKVVPVVKNVFQKVAPVVKKIAPQVLPQYSDQINKFLDGGEKVLNVADQFTDRNGGINNGIRMVPSLLKRRIGGT
jgi:phage-related protein